ncbi:MAG: penicillin acylase family protein [Xanthobacteraceae bacterium]|nr:penicillin acylase family protein [Xanthobacteraceae bacterium]
MRILSTDESTIVLADSALRAPVTIAADRYGLNHILAENENDLFFAQGFNAARARLWQIDLWRRRGLGLLAEVLGPGFAAQDRACRTFLYAGDMQREWASYPAGTKDICEHFCRGINAFVERVRQGQAPLPEEFAVLDFAPSFWRAEDIVRIRTNTITANAVSELKRTALLQQDHERVDRLRAVLRPFRPQLRVEATIDRPEELIALLELATAPVLITRERLQAGFADVEKWSDPQAFASADNRAATPGAVEGSNNWAIAGARTATGAPILASDPHRTLQNPSLRYVVHLHCPSFSVVGAGEPALPGISIGHNESVGFGLTIFPADQEDVFVFDPSASEAEEKLIAEQVVVPMRGAPPLQVELARFAGHPVLRLDRRAGHGIALRTVWSESGASPYLASLALLRVKSVHEFRSHLARWRLPAVNFVAADRAGSIGWFVAGAIPKRAAGVGLIPRKIGEDPWVGFIDNEELPTSIDPPTGYVLSANEYNLPDSWDSSAQPLAFEWYDGFRARRIHEVLREQRAAGLADSEALQDDVLSVAARDLLQIVLATFSSQFLEAQPEALCAFLRWDARIDNETPHAAFYSHWVRSYLKPAILAKQDAAAASHWVADISLEALIDELKTLDIAQRRELLECSLQTATGSFNWFSFSPRRAVFRHAIADDVVDGTCFSPPAVVWSGDETTVHYGRSGANPYQIESGASFRMILELANWDNSRWSNIPDQSKPEPGKPTAPLLYSLDRIAKEIVATTRLVSDHTVADSLSYS